MTWPVMLLICSDSVTLNCHPSICFTCGAWLNQNVLGMLMDFVSEINGVPPTSPKMLADRNNIPSYSIAVFWKLVVYNLFCWGRNGINGFFLRHPPLTGILPCFLHSLGRFIHKHELIAQWSSCWSRGACWGYFQGLLIYFSQQMTNINGAIINLNIGKP